MLRRSHILTAGALMALCVAPGSAVAMPDQPAPPSSIAQSAGPAYNDLRSPDARDAAVQAAEPQVAQDLRSPDARDAAVQADTPQVAQDLRSPDARDAGRVAPTVQQPIVEIRQVPSNGFDWGDAGIGAAGIFAMFSIAAGLTLLLGSRRRRRGVQPAL
jgi:hypothetical protein